MRVDVVRGGMGLSLIVVSRSVVVERSESLELESNCVGRELGLEVEGSRMCRVQCVLGFRLL